MPIIDNRPNTGAPSGGGGGAGDLLATKNAIKLDWRVEQITVSAAELLAGYVTASGPFQDTKVLVELLGFGPLDQGVDFSITAVNGQINFEAATLADMQALYNKYGDLKIRTAFFRAS